MKNKMMVSDICEAFKDKVVGSKVHPQHLADFFDVLDEAVSNYDFSQGKVPGQAVIELPSKVNDWVSPGSWKRGSIDPNDFVLRKYRGEVGMYLLRKPDMTSARVRCVVYTRDAYEADPDFTEDEALRMEEFFGNPFDGGYVLVAVLGDPDNVPSTVSFGRFVKNLAGANNEYAVMNKAAVVALAKKVVDYRSRYMGVAD